MAIKRIRQTKTETPSAPIPIASADISDDDISIGDMPKIDEKFEKIISVVVDVEPEETWKEIRAWISTTPQSPLHLRELLYEQAGIAEKAKRLSLAAKMERERFERLFKDKMQILRDDALGYWEGEKNNKGLNKQITEKMIEDHIIQEHWHSYDELNKRLVSIKSAEEMFKELYEIVIGRGVDLRKVLDMESRRPGALAWMDGKDSTKK